MVKKHFIIFAKKKTALMIQNTSIPKGTRDFLPEETTKRNYIFSTIRSIFELYGYAPIETPAMENLSTLLGKYGDEGDKLVFKILNSGNYLKNVDHELLETANSANISGSIAEKGLRYDLTVPFARYVVKNRNELTLPFKRYQIQPVWRADKPQKGRYREFFQCDVDVIGTNSMLNEYELILVINQVFSELNINTCLKINNRKILAGLFEVVGESDKFIPITVAIDKIDKIGIEKVIEELHNLGLSQKAVETLQKILRLNRDNEQSVLMLKEVLANSEIGIQGICELEKVLAYTENDNLFIDIKFDISLARGLNYYTGTIFEVLAKDVQIGSICGGGRYDNLTEVFGLKDVSGVGISFGAERIYDVMEYADLFPKNAQTLTKVLFVNFGEEEEKLCIKLAKELRTNGISTDIYPDTAKMKKQMQYANKKKIPYVIIIGEEELKSDSVTLKDMESGEQSKVKSEDLSEVIMKYLSKQQ